MLGYLVNDVPYCHRHAEEGEPISDECEYDNVLRCDNCNRLIPVPLSADGVATLASDLIPRAVDGYADDHDKEVWCLYGHLLIAYLRDQFAA